MGSLKLSSGGSVKLAGMVSDDGSKFSQELCFVNNSPEYDITKPYKTYSDSYCFDIGYQGDVDLVPLPDSSPLLINTHDRSMLSGFLLMSSDYVMEALTEQFCAYSLCVVGYAYNSVTGKWHPNSCHEAVKDVDGNLYYLTDYQVGIDSFQKLNMMYLGDTYYMSAPLWMQTLGASRVQVMLLDRRIERTESTSSFTGKVLLYCTHV